MQLSVKDQCHSTFPLQYNGPLAVIYGVFQIYVEINGLNLVKGIDGFVKPYGIGPPYTKI